MADVGIVGLPNAGKSTFISQISNARPKIANYQFTTLTPVLGMVNIKNNTMMFEDIPGLIEGASSGKGLGMEFLKHIERCYVLIHMISLSKSDNEEIIDSYHVIENELKQYGRGVEEKPIILVGNKIDMDDYQDNLKILEKKLKTKIFTISAKDRTNIDELLNTIYDKYSAIINSLKSKLNESIEEKTHEDINKRRRDENDRLIDAVKVTKIDEHKYLAESEYLSY
jgi:GTP-binding protein